MLLGIAKSLRSFVEVFSPKIGRLEYLYLSSYTDMVERYPQKCSPGAVAPVSKYGEFPKQSEI